MNLQPLYDVKTRLEQAAVAGTGLLSEDFRLARAAEAMKPLAAASPVFAKIEQGLRALPEVPAAARGAALLDLLALVDAVVYTQAKAGAPGALAPLPAGCGRCQEAAYSQMQPLLAALTTSGGGRMEAVRAAWEAHPEFFTDYRVLPALVAGLGDSYGDIADQNAKILEQLGPEVLPQLKQGFDPAGKKEMARRVQIVDAIAGAAENAWYLEQLPNAKKMIRQVLLLALRHDPANAPLLARLCETEKNDCKLAARFALARNESPEARGCLEALGRKSRLDALDAMRCSRTRAATELTAQYFIETMRQVQQNPAMPLGKEEYLLLERLRSAIEYKTGPQICEAYRQAAQVGTALDRDYSFEENGKVKQEPMLFYCMGASNSPEGRRCFSEAVHINLMRSIQFTRDPGLCALAWELADTCGGPWVAPALVATLLTDDSETAGRKMKELLYPKRTLFSRRRPVDRRMALRDALWGLYWDREKGCYKYALYVSDLADNLKAYYRRSEQPVFTGRLDAAWFEALMDTSGLDQQLINLIPDRGAAGLEQVGRYLYEQITHSSATRRNYVGHVHALEWCGWTDWEDFYVKCAKARGEVWYYEVRSELNILPISGREKAAQLRKITDLVWAKKIKAKGGKWPDAQIKELIAEWESELPQ